MNKLILIGLVLIAAIAGLVYYAQNKTEDMDLERTFDDGTKMYKKLKWDNVGNLVTRTTKFINEKDPQKNATNVLPFKNGNIVEIEGEKYLKQEADYLSAILTQKPKGATFIYSQNKNIVYSETDDNGDAKIDVVSYCKNNIINLSKESAKHNGIFDVWQHYDDSGTPTYSEYDSNGDGKPDTKGLPPVPEKNIINYKMGQKN
jgi:hypothetical protein